jgi:ribosomal protein S18 acetylase RimI-like enzyme
VEDFMTDFSAMSRSEIVDFLVAHQHELGIADLAAEKVNHSLESGEAALEMRPYGFALIQHTPSNDGVIPHLWALYIDSDKRGSGLGSRFVRELIKQYSTKHHMTVWCDGSQRRRFFGRLGFVVERRVGDIRRMTTNRARAIRRFSPEGA